MTKQQLFRIVSFWLVAIIAISFTAQDSWSLPPAKKQTKVSKKELPKATKTKAKVTKANPTSQSADEEPTREEQQTSETACKSSILMDAKSGEILFEQNSDASLPPASMIKIMTAYVILKKIEEGGASLSDVITVSAHASKIGGSQVYLKEGEQFTLSQLLEALMIQSANDAAVAIAEHIAGEPSAFVDMMNDEARSLGMKETQINSPHGLPPSKDQRVDLTSAHDLAILAQILISKYPEILELSSRQTGPFRDGTLTMTSSNHLLKTFPGCDGLKTGFTVQAGFGVTATAQRNGMRMIAVVMGCENGKKRFSEAARLLSLGFSQYKTVKLIDQGIQAKTSIPVVGGEKSETSVVTAQPLSITTKTSETQNVVQKEEVCKELKAPVAKGTSCGSIAFYSNTKEIGRVTLVTTEDIKAIGMGGKLLKTLHLK